MRAIDNSPHGKRELLLPHNRKPGAAARDDTRRWRRLRRGVKRWLSKIVEAL